MSEFLCPRCNKEIDEYDEAAGRDTERCLFCCPICEELIFFEYDFRYLYEHLVDRLPVKSVVLRNGQQFRWVDPVDIGHQLLWQGVFVTGDEKNVFACKGDALPWDRVDIHTHASKGRRPQVNLPTTEKNRNGKPTYTYPKVYRLKGYAWDGLKTTEIMRHPGDDRTASRRLPTIPGKRADNASDFQEARRLGTLPHEEGVFTHSIQRGIVRQLESIFGLNGDRLTEKVNWILAGYIKTATLQPGRVSYIR